MFDKRSLLQGLKATVQALAGAHAPDSQDELLLFKSELPSHKLPFICILLDMLVDSWPILGLIPDFLGFFFLEVNTSVTTFDHLLCVLLPARLKGYSQDLELRLAALLGGALGDVLFPPGDCQVTSLDLSFMHVLLE